MHDLAPKRQIYEEATQKHETGAVMVFVQEKFFWMSLSLLRGKWSHKASYRKGKKKKSISTSNRLSLKMNDSCYTSVDVSIRFACQGRVTSDNFMQGLT